MDNLKLLAIVTGEGEFVNKNLRTGLWVTILFSALTRMFPKPTFAP